MNIEINPDKLRDLYLRDFALGKTQGPLQGKPSIDKPWLKYYKEEAILTHLENENILDYIKRENKDRLGSIAIEYFNRKMTYQEFFNRIDITAKAFMEMGVKENDIVTLSLPNTPENLIAFYAIVEIGAVANLIDLRLKSEKLQNAINKTGSKYIITSDLFTQNLDEVINNTTIEKVVVSSPVEELNPIIKKLYKIKSKLHKPQNFEYQTWKQFYETGILSNKKITYKPSLNDSICILHTSGTTGDSKGVVLTNKNFNAMATQLKDCGFDLKPGDRFLNQVPPFLAFNELIASHFPLSKGVILRLLPDYQPDIFYKNIAKYKPNHTVAGPADWNSFAEHKEALNRNYDYLTTMVSGSDKFNEETKEKVNKMFKDGGSNSKVTEGYGMTEVGSAAVTNLPQINVKDSVGIPLPDVNICIYDNDNEKEVGFNTLGEICFNGPTVMKEYYNNKEATDEVLRKHEDGKYWMHSGDLGYMDENGCIFLKGRIKRTIIRHDGIKVSPLDIERIINSHPFVQNTCVIGVDDYEHGFGSVPVANVVLKDNILLEEDELKEQIRDYCKRNLSEKYLPKDIVFKKDLPLTSVGKVDYRKLIEEYQNNIKSQIR